MLQHNASLPVYSELLLTAEETDKCVMFGVKDSAPFWTSHILAVTRPRDVTESLVSNQSQLTVLHYLCDVIRQM